MASENNIDVEKMLEALNINANQAAASLGRLNDETDLATEYEQNSLKTNRAVQKEFESLGLILKKTVGVEGEIFTTLKKSEEQLKKRQKLDEETYKILEATQAGFKSLTKAQQEEEVARMRSAAMLDQQLASMNKVINENGKIVDLSIKLTKADEMRLKSVQAEEAAMKKQQQAIAGVANALVALPGKLAVMALKFQFDKLIGGIDATYKGMIAYEDALLEGRVGETTASIILREQMQAEADAHGNLAESLKSTGMEFIELGATLTTSIVTFKALQWTAAALEVELAALAAPVLALVGIVVAVGGAFMWLKGREEEQTKKAIEYAKKRTEDQGKQAERLFDSYEKLSSASLIGSRGLEGFMGDLHKVGLTVSQFEKLNKVLIENQKDMKLFGAGAVDGAKQFADTAGSLIRSELGGQLRAMGITQEEQMSHVANFMAMQSKTGIKASGDQAKAAGAYIKELDKMAVITGQSRKEAEDAKKSLLQMNQLRAAIMMAEKRGDTKELARLNNYLDTATDIYKTDPEYAGAIAKYAASGVTDAMTAKVAQDQGGKGGAIEMIESGQGTRAERAKAVAGGVMAREEQFGDTTRITGGIAGVTVNEGKLGEWMDLKKGITNMDEAAQKAGKTLDQYTEDQRKPNADAIAAANLRIQQLEEAIAKDKALRDGQLDAAHATAMQAAATKSYLDSFLGGLGKWWDDFTTDSAKYNADMFAKIDELTGKLKSGFTSIIDSLSKSFDGMFDKISAAIKSLINLIPGAGAAIDKAKEVGGKVGSAVSGAASSVGGAISRADDAVTGAATSLGQYLGMVAPTPSGGGSGSGGGGGASKSAAAPAAAPAAGRAAPAAAPAAPSGGGGKDGGGAGKTPMSGGSEPPSSGKGKGYGTPLSENEVKAMIKRHEGFRDKPYKDSLGLWTVGVGHLIGDGKSLPDAWNRTFSYDEINDMFEKDFAEHKSAASRISGYNKFNTTGQGGLIDLTFNMGSRKFPGEFPNTSKAIAKGDGSGTAAGLIDSKWYTQVGDRAPEIVDLMRSGGISAKDGGITDGPMSGYPATLHGNEIISPLSPNSILEQLAKTPAVASAVAANQSNASDILMELHELMETKFNDMINTLKDGNDLTDKLLKYSMV